MDISRINVGTLYMGLLDQYVVTEVNHGRSWANVTLTNGHRQFEATVHTYSTDEWRWQ